MDALMALCGRAGRAVIEDCAHTMGAEWRGVPSGRHGVIGCYSMQTYKHMNSGEGGFLVSDDAGLMARAILLSGSYMLYARHRAAPPPEAFEGIRLDAQHLGPDGQPARGDPAPADRPAARPRGAVGGAVPDTAGGGAGRVPGLQVIPRPDHERFVGSSFQFLLPDWPAPRVQAVVARGGAGGGAEVVRRGRSRGLHLALRPLAYAAPPTRCRRPTASWPG
jgi:hypothetical protein